jgi:UbiD family decarboxylase
MKDVEYIPPVETTASLLFENVLEGGAVDVFKLPVPIHHELDGGRYIGTACAVITQDPDSGWINAGT